MSNEVFRRLPADLHPLLMEFVGPTRYDWRTCKLHEARVISNYHAWIQQLAQEILARRPIPNVALSKLWICGEHLWHFRFWMGAKLFLMWAFN